MGNMTGIFTQSPSMVTTFGESSRSMRKCRGSKDRPLILPSQWRQ
jgi:hypothetical protein